MWSDKESYSDYLNFGEVSNLAVDILNSKEMLPVSLGIFGNWGAGKSSLLNLIEKRLKEQEPKTLVIKFDAWLYQGFDDARASLLEVIANQINNAVEGNKELSEKIKNLIKRIDGFRTVGLALDVAAFMAGIPTGGIASRFMGGISNFGESDNTANEIKNVVKDGNKLLDEVQNVDKKAHLLSPPKQIDKFRKEYGEVLDELNMPVVVTIDNLDRCLPSNAIHTLEAIRLFLFLPNTAFVIAADEEMIRTSVAEHFKGASKRHEIDYIDKLIQVPIRVPKAGVLEVRSYLFTLYAIDYGVDGENLETLRLGLEEALQQSWHSDPISKEVALELTGMSHNEDLARSYDLADRIAPMLANSPIISGNPRTIKRLMNVVKMRSKVAKRRRIPLDEGTITKLVIFERCAGTQVTSELYKLIDTENGMPSILNELEKDNVKKLPVKLQSWTKDERIKEFILEWAQLKPKLGNKDLRSAIYLSRETLPVGFYGTTLSPQGQEAIKVLSQTMSVNSPSANKAIDVLPLEECTAVMEVIIEQLTQVTDWAKKPKGFIGGSILSDKDPGSAKVFVRFIKGLKIKNPPWMKAALKDKEWYN